MKLGLTLPLPLLALLAMPAQAEEAVLYHASETWPVHAAAGTCTMTRAGMPETGHGRLTVSYDAAANEVTLATTERIDASLPPSGRLPMHIVFLDNGRMKHDDQWASRTFAYTSEDGVYRFATAFAGENNVRQILADLANSRRLGLLREGEVVFDHDLAGARQSIARLRDCAARPLAAR